MKIFRTLSVASRELPRVLPLFRDARVPLVAKIAAIFAGLFIISPLNVLGDIPLLGFLDDAALLLFVVHTFVRFAEDRLVAAPMKAADVRTDPRAPDGARSSTASGMLSR